MKIKLPYLDIQYLIHKGKWLFFLRFVTALTGVVTTYLFTQYLSKESYGQYRYIISMLSILLVFSLPGINLAITRSVAKNEPIQLWKIAIIEMKFASIGSLCSLVIAGYYWTQGNYFFAWSFVVLALAVPFYESFLVSSGYLKGIQDFKSVSLQQSVIGTVQSFLAIVVLILTKNVVFTIAAYVSSQILTSFIFFKITIKKKNEKKDTLDEKINNETKALIQFGKSLSLTQVFGRVSNQIDKLLIWFVFGAQVLAVYSVAFVIQKAIQLMTGFLTALALPRFSQRDMTHKVHMHEMYKKMLLYFILLLSIYITYVWFAPTLFSLFFPEYMEAVNMSRVLTSIILVAPFRMILDQIYIATKNINGIYIYRIAEVCIYIAVFVILYLLRIDPLIIVAITLPVQYVCTFLIQLLLNKKKYESA
jgi:O-antigen/teichoic acid export membrane protein